MTLQTTPPVPQPCQASRSPTTIKEVSREVPSPCYICHRQHEESHRIRNTVDISAIFEIWSFQTKPGNFLLSAVKEVTLPVPTCKTWLSSHTHREEMQQEKRLTLHSALCLLSTFCKWGAWNRAVSRDTGASPPGAQSQGNTDWKN